MTDQNDNYEEDDNYEQQYNIIEQKLSRRKGLHVLEI